MNQRKLLAGLAVAAIFVTAAVVISAKSNTGSRPANPAVVEVTSDQKNPAVPKPSRVASDTDARAVLAVQGMSCSGCINEIKSSLSGIQGVGDVLVDLTTGRVEVNYDSGALQDTGRIASAISAVGYPATLQQTLSKTEIEEQNRFLASRARLYVAAVGEWEIARADFNTEMAHARTRYESIYGSKVFDGDQGAVLLQRIQSQIVSRLIDEGIQMQEILKAGYKVSPEVVEQEYDQFLEAKNVSREQFEQMLAASGYNADYFMKKFTYRVTVERYVDEKVFTDLMNDAQKQQQYADWFNNARLLSRVTFYDRDLERIVKSNSASSGCGSGCSSKQSG